MSVADVQRAFRPALTHDPERSYTLPARFYTDPQVFVREREAIFFRTWQFVGHVEDLRDIGSYVTCNVLDQDLFVIRGKGGKLRAFYNVCQHRAHELLRGSGRVRVITCPYHAWSYQIDGRLRTARGSERVSGFDPSDFCLTQVQLEEFCNFIFVNLDPDAPPLRQEAPDLEAELRSMVPALDKLTKVESAQWTLEANWKVIVDNFLECYHCSIAHPAFAKLVDIKRYRSKTEKFHSTHICPSGRGDNPAYRFDPKDETQAAVFWWLWPTMTFNMVPSPPNIALFYLKPLGPEKTVEIVDFYFAHKELSETERGRIDYATTVLQIEDNNLCESVQRGLRSRGYERGRFMVNPERDELSEHAVHHFQSLVAEALGESV